MGKIKMIGCVCCWKRGFEGVLSAADHEVRGNRRVGHHATLAMCDWHHQGYLIFGLSKRDTIAERGPSLADGSKPFYAFFGSREELMEFQQTLIEEKDCGH
jgi:hypothetical protein